MKQFVQITGAKPQEALWFSRLCNALAGQIGHTPRDVQGASIYNVEDLNRAPGTLCGLLLAYYSALVRHVDPVYEFMT